MTPPLPSAQAWQPLPRSHWNDATARHLLRRTGWSADPEEVARAVRDGLPATLERLFPAEPPPFPRPKLTEEERTRAPEFRQRVRAADGPEARQNIQREQRDLSRNANNDLVLRWLQQAATPANSAFEKWLLFLSDIYVVSVEKVRSANLIYEHADILRQGALGPAPDLTKGVSRSGAMLNYLDLQRSGKKAPNENFARELLELFTLGEGHYTENDIKEAARAFTGYRFRGDKFHFDTNKFDQGQKTIFGQTGFFNGDDVIDLVYKQPAAGTFLPREMTRFYLTDQVPDADYFEPLAAWWRERGHNLRDLCHRYFSSILFHHPSYRANYIKSPVHYHLGLLQDLRLDVTPLPRTTLNPLRQMGQQVFNPPNVRGWVGGRLWINSSTLAARRQLVQTLFTAINEDKINADDRVALDAARAEGHDRFTVDDARLESFAALGVDGMVDRFVTYFLPSPAHDAFRGALREFLADNPDTRRIREAAIAVLQTPEYQLC